MILSYILGIILVSVSMTFMFLYTNLFTLDYTFIDYILYIMTKIECLIFIPGVLLIIKSFRVKNR